MPHNGPYVALPTMNCPECQEGLEPWPSRPWEFVCPTFGCPMEHRTVFRVDVENLRTDEKGHVVKVDPNEPAHYIELREDAE